MQSKLLVTRKSHYELAEVFNGLKETDRFDHEAFTVTNGEFNGGPVVIVQPVFGPNLVISLESSQKEDVATQ